MTEVLSPSAKQQFFDNNGRPLVGGKLFTYAAGSSTKLATYTNSGGLTQNTNPVILDYRGECNLWIPPNVAYKYVLAPSTDTDPPANPIWSVDNVVSDQLITLYGGVDTGVADAYVLTFDANFTAYTDGIIIYWTPANSNTGASTINVNGLGPVAITNQDGTALVDGQIVADEITAILYRTGGFVLMPQGTANPAGTITPTWAGFSVDPTGTVSYRRSGNIVTIIFSVTSGTSNATSFSMSGIPAALRPGLDQSGVIGGMYDNGVNLTTPSLWILDHITGTVAFSKDCTGTLTNWTNSGTKGFATLGGIITYAL